MHAARHGHPLRRSRRPGDGPRHHRASRASTCTGDDEVVGMVVADPEGFLLTVCENGYGKRTPFGANTAGEEAESEEAEEAVETPETPRPNPPRARTRRPKRSLGDALPQAAPRRQGRSRHPHQRTQRPGRRHRCRCATATTSCSSPRRAWSTARTSSEIRVVGRNTQGVRVMNLNEGDKIASLAKVAHEEVDEAAADSAAPLHRSEVRRTDRQWWASTEPDSSVSTHPTKSGSAAMVGLDRA